ncbi:hypothetical protein [Corynebacterium ureicelerivorans]|uniref:hypothetical protein n=1 Tax=Corynebacterium ureicelerivorans TaxID=401472 RepID=UPI000AE15713|nr:hypothetical protein [Corynebacterium ureicelerivorans]
MVRVSGPLRVVTDRPLLVSQVRVRAARDRAEQGGLTTSFDDSVPVDGGQLDMVVLPGPAVMMLEVTGGFSHAVKLVVPDVAEATLEQCVVAAQVAGDTDRRVLERLAGEVARDVAAVSDAAARAEASAGKAAASEQEATRQAEVATAGANRVGSAERVLEAEAAAVGAATSAAEDAEAVEASRAAVAQLSQQAEQSSVAAADSARKAFDSQTVADEKASAVSRTLSEFSAGLDRNQSLYESLQDALATTEAFRSNQAFLEEVKTLLAEGDAATIEKITGAAPEALDTLGELAAALESGDEALRTLIESKTSRLRGLPEPMAKQVDVAALVGENRAGLAEGHTYSDPSTEQVMGMVSAAMALARGVKPASLPDGAEVIEGYSAAAKRNVRVLRSTPGNGLYWGMWVFPVDSVVSGVVEAPHPVFDGGSDDIAVQVWQRSPAGTVLAVAGSHRTNPDGTDPRDAAHNTKSMWHKVTTKIAQPGQPELQLHGFGDASMPGVGAVVSSGSSPLSAGVIRTEAFIASAGITTARQWDGSATKLIGMANIQGDVAAQRGNPFLHIELAKTVRDNPQKLVDAIVGAGFLTGENAALLTNEYPKPVGSANSRGSSMTAARADHTHRLVQNDPADGEVVVRQDGGWRSVPTSQIAPPIPQSVLDATAQVEAATYSATAGTIMRRTSKGAVSVADPTAGVHAANKNYVDATVQQGLDTVVREARAYTDALIVEGDTGAADGKLHIVYE